MCKYCERRTDVKLGWNQPELPWHHNQDITKNISGNMIHTDDTVGVINDYQTASPVLIIKDKSCFGSESFNSFLSSCVIISGLIASRSIGIRVIASKYMN